MCNKYSAVGVFDSGLGGLTALKELRALLPHEHFIYFGDTGRVPYGTRSQETILQYADDDMHFLSSFDIKAAVVACGTVSSVALPKLKENFPFLPIVGAVEPACHTALRESENKKIAVFATPATIGKKAFEITLSRLCRSVTVFPVACPMFVPLIEGGYIAPDCTVTRLIAAEYLEKLRGADIDTLILGCTHYPIIRELIASVSAEVLGKSPRIIDAGYEAALAAKELLSAQNVLNDSAEKGSVRYFVSDETQNFTAVASIFLGEPAENVQKVVLGS